MRTVWVTLTLLVVTAIYAPTLVIARLLRVPDGRGSIYERVMQSWARSVIRAAGVHVNVHGAERIDPKQGAVFISNHVSWFDVFALASVLPHYTFVAKSELRRIPFFGFGATAAGVVFLERDNRKQAFQSYEGAAAQVKRGRSVVVCPEGTRGRDYHLRPFKKGPFVLAIAAQCMVIPTIVYGQREVMPKGSFRIKPGTIDVHFLEPVSTVGYDYPHRTELMTAVWHRMADAMALLYGVGTSEYPIAKEGERTDATEQSAD